MRLLRHEAGASLVEFALAAVVFFAIVFGLMGACLTFYSYQATAYTARMASRWAMVRGADSCTNTPNLTDCNATPAQIQTYAQGLGFLGMDSTRMTVTTTWLSSNGATPASWSACSASPCNAPGNQVQVQVQYAFPFSVPFVPSTLLNVASTSAAVISQ